jgi:hypothetical protein
MVLPQRLDADTCIVPTGGPAACGTCRSTSGRHERNARPGPLPDQGRLLDIRSKFMSDGVVPEGHSAADLALLGAQQSAWPRQRSPAPPRNPADGGRAQGAEGAQRGTAGFRLGRDRHALPRDSAARRRGRADRPQRRRAREARRQHVQRRSRAARAVRGGRLVRAGDGNQRTRSRPCPSGLPCR